MPAGAVEGRSEQLALLAGLLHERGTDPRLGELLDELEGSPLLADAASPAAVNVRELRRDYERFVRLPRKLVQDLARSTAVAQRAWSTARQTAEFERFRPHLERIVELKRAEAQCVGYAREPYDALIEDYEPGITSAIVGRLFDALRRELVPLAARIADAGRRPETGVLRRAVPLRGPVRLLRAGRRRVSASISAAGVWIWASTPAAPASAPATAASGSGSICAISPEACSRCSTRWATGSTSRDSTRTTTAPRWGRRRRSAWTRRRPGSGRTGSAGAAAFWEHFLPEARRRFPDALGDVRAGRVSRRDQPGESLADQGARGRGHLQRACHDPVRAGARAGVG